jgi:hypothetical protein
MADKKISELTALTGANVADTDLLPIVDTSATETKKITFGEFKTALDTATGFVRITGDTMTGALDVQSTITADGLTVDVASGSEGAKFSTNDATAANNAGIFIYNIASATAATRNSQLILDPSGANASGGDYLIISAKGDNSASIINYHATSTLMLGTAGQQRQLIAANGDISFYEDTGTTAKFFWDASAEELQLGDNLLALTPVTTGTTGSRISANGGGMLRLASGGSDKMYVLDSGNVGIGTSSPPQRRHHGGEYWG